MTIEDVELAPPGPDEVQVTVEACAICHSDITYIDGGWGGDLPAVFGHEAAGVVKAVGACVRDLSQGDRVLVTLIRSCGSCHYCAQGRLVACETALPLDLKSPIRAVDGSSIRQGLRTGAFAQAVTVDRSQLATIPAKLPFDSACLLSCGVITGLGAVTNTAGVRSGESVVVIGTGGVGLNSVQGARLVGADPIIAIDMSGDRRIAARYFGATHAIAPKGAVDEVRALTRGRGADHVLVAVGNSSVMTAAQEMLAKCGTITIVGMPPDGQSVTYDPGELAGNQQRILGSKMGSTRLTVDIPRLVSLWERGEILLEELVSNRYPFERINDAIDASRRGEGLRNVVTF